MPQRQTQRSGDGSTNVQGEHVEYTALAQYGISYDDAKSIALEVYESNITRFTKIAHEAALERAKNFTEKLLGDIAPESLEALKDPDVQRMLFMAQQEFACSGEDEIGDTLVKLLAERITNSRDGMRRLVVNEALRLTPRLTPDHISLLTCNFFLKYVSFAEIRTAQDLATELEKALRFHQEDIFRLGQSDIDYLLGTGCLTVTSGFIQESMSPGRYMGLNYPGIFTQGFTLNDFPNGHLLIDTPLIESYSSTDGDRYRVRAISESDLDVILRRYNLEEKREAAMSALRSRVQPEHVILEEVLLHVPHLRNFFNRWKALGMSSYKSSSSAVAIAHANARRLSNGEFSTPLGNWLDPQGEFD